MNQNNHWLPLLLPKFLQLTLCLLALSLLAIPTMSAADDLEDGKSILFNAQNRFEYAEAVELLEKAVAADPERAEAQLLLVRAYSKTFRVADAPEHVAMAEAHRDQLDRHDALWLDALAAWAADSPSVTGSWNAVVAEYPDDRWAWYELSAAHSVNNEQEMAAMAAARAVEIEPDAMRWEASWLYYLHAKSLYRSGQYEEAVEAAEPGRNNPTTWRSTSYRQSLAKVKAYELPQDEIEELVGEYRKQSEAEGRNNAAITESNIALFYFELGDYERAVSYARISLDMESSGSTFWVLGFSLTENGEVEEALLVLKSARETYQEDWMVQVAYGWALYRAGRFEEALEQLILAQAANTRRQQIIESQIEIIENAIADPDAEAAPPIPWLG